MSVMTKKQLTAVKDALAGSAYMNTTRTFSLSIQEVEIADFYNGRILVYPNDNQFGFGKFAIKHLFAISDVFGVFVQLVIRNGVIVVDFN